MPAKRKFKLDNFLEVLTIKSGLSTGVIARRLKCHVSTARRYLRELKKVKQVIEQRISNTINLWKLTGKRILLIDVDSTIPNLALMKISTYHKAKGDNIQLLKIKLKRRKDGTLKEAVKIDFSGKPDKTYISVIFKKNKQVVDELVSQHPEIEIDIGGSGYDITKELPEYIENVAPDYSLYPDSDASIGFSSRGCFRKCHFCIVDQKEGKFRRTHHPERWYNPAFKKITFLDNNILIDKEWFFEVTSWCMERKLEIQFNQGLDIRLVDEEIARRLLEMPKHGMINFAWDDIKTEQSIRKGIELLKQAGFTKNKLRAKVQFYVYVHDDSDYDSGVYRCRELKKMWCNSYVMYNIDNEHTKRIYDLQRWTIRKVLYWLNDVADYKQNIRAAKTIRSKRAKGAKAMNA